MPTDAWVPLVVRLDGTTIEVFVSGKGVLRHDDGPTALPAGTVGLRQRQREAKYRNLWARTGGTTHKLSFDALPDDPPKVSGLWRPFGPERRTAPTP